MPVEYFENTCPSGEVIEIELDGDVRFARIKTKSGAMLFLKINEYVMKKKIGQGGMGCVYLATDRDQRDVAIKIIENPDTKMLDHFLRECMLQRDIRHENIIHILAQGCYERMFYIVMEYFPGMSLYEVLKKRHLLPPRDAAKIVLKVLSALQYAGQFHLIHRDIKPDNIYITLQGDVKLLDLGLAKISGESYGVSDTYSMKGTPYYMPYDQYVCTRDVDQRADIYALGATFYHIVSGDAPFSECPMSQIVSAKKEDRYIRLSEKGLNIPSSLVAIIEKAMANLPENRYQSAEEMIKELRAIYKEL